MAELQTANEAHVLPYKHWWGLLGCAGLMGVIFAMGPYSEGLVLEPDRGDMWYFWQLHEPTENDSVLYRDEYNNVRLWLYEPQLYENTVNYPQRP